MTQSGDPGHPELEPNSSPLLLESRERLGAPPPPISSAGYSQEGGSERQEEEEVRGKQQGGAREDNSKGKLYSSDRQQHPQPQHSTELSLWRGESKPLPSWRVADRDSQETRERAERKGGHLQEACSLKQEQERSSGQAGVSGRRLLLQRKEMRSSEEIKV